MGSIYWGDSRLIDINSFYEIHSLSFPVLGCTHSFPAFIDSWNLSGFSRQDTAFNPLPLLQCSSSQNHSFSQIPFGCCGSSAVSSHHDRVIIEMYPDTMIEQVWRCTWRRRLSELRDALWGSNRATLEAMIVWTRRLWWNEFGDALEGRDWVTWEMNLEAVIERLRRYTWRL